MKLAGVIIARNEAENIIDCIETLQWTDEVVVFESNNSTDSTVKLAHQAGATVIRHPFENYAQQRNAALDTIDADWVLFVDADERVPTALRSEIRRTLKNAMHSGYYIPRHNYIFGKLTRHTGWYPDYQMRLLKRDTVRYNPDIKVHEVVILPEGEHPGYLNNPFVHYNYKNVRHFISKQRRYAKYDAQVMYDSGIRPKPRNFILQPLRQFTYRFLTLKGYRDGWHGLKLSLLMAWNEFDKYWKLRQIS